MIKPGELHELERLVAEDEEALDKPTARETLDAFSKEESAQPPDTNPPVGRVPSRGDSPAAPASAAVTLSALVEEIRKLHARIEREVPLAITRMADDPYDALLALKQESGKLNDTLYTLWLRHACASLKQP